MAKLMMDALKIAYAKKVVQIPSIAKTKNTSRQPTEKRPLALHPVQIQGKVRSEKFPEARKSVHTQKPSRAEKIKRYMDSQQKSRDDRSSKDLNEDAYKIPASSTTKISHATKPVDNIPSWTLSISPEAKIHQFLSEKFDEYKLISAVGDGIAEQFSKDIGDSDTRDMVIGLDFGTSSVKVVIGDQSTKKAFAIPFADINGINGYLLPSRLWQTGDNYSLIEGSNVHRDLKLSLLNDSEEQGHIERATAFIALVIRRVRGWLFTKHEEIYCNTKMVWKLVLGIPAASYETNSESQKIVSKFRLIAKAAWLAAGIKNKKIFVGSIGYSLKRAKMLLSGDVPNNDSEEVEVEVVPELAAQIYGFCVSQSFDKKAENIFMTVDVGAGTVDSSVFQVKKGKAGRWDFIFFTNQVQQNGVMNLHRMRVNWLSDALIGKGTLASQLTEKIHLNSLHTDHHGTIPNSIDEYLSDVELKFTDTTNHPDEVFFKQRVTRQVRSDTLYQARNYLLQQQITGIPMFLCGGGVRTPYYQRLKKELAFIPNTTWLKAEKRELVKPSNLIAPGLSYLDFDRLSVAFGLSFLDVGKVIRAIPMPKVASKIQTDKYSDQYVDKDMV